MPHKVRPDNSISPDQVDCYIKWLRLKGDATFLQASDEIRALKDKAEKADKRFTQAHKVYEQVLRSDGPERNAAQKTYWEAEEACRKARKTLEEKERDVCNRFGLFMWWDPQSDSITIQNAQAIFEPSFQVEVLEPPPKQPRALFTQSTRLTPFPCDVTPSPFPLLSMADKDGWLTLKVNLNASLEETEPLIGRLLRFYRNKPKARKRPDTDAMALETWVCYDQTKQFSAVGRQLKRRVSTVKGQYVRACVLIHGAKPTGSMKQRRAGIMRDPGGEFEAHFGSCSRCQKADTAGKMCPKYLAFVTQDTKAELDTRASRELAKHGNKGRRKPAKPADEIMQ